MQSIIFINIELYCALIFMMVTSTTPNEMEMETTADLPIIAKTLRIIPLWDLITTIPPPIELPLVF